jgi:heat shock protein HtpX
VIGINRAKTWVLIAALGGFFVLIGYWLRGPAGAWWFLVIALAINFALYWFSDRIAIATTRSRPVSEQSTPGCTRSCAS